MIQVKFEKAASLLKVTYVGVIGAEEARRGADDIERVVKDLETGFRLLTDLSGLESMDLACVPEIERVMDLCNQKGVHLVVRIIPDPHKDIGFNILSLFHYRRGVRIITCASSAEAQKVLAQ